MSTKLLRRTGRALSFFAAIAVALPMVSGCARAHAKAPVPPPLDVPAPPERIVEPLDAEVVAPAPRVPDDAPRAAPARPRPAPPPRPEPARAEAPKPEPPKVEAPKVEPSPNEPAKVAEEPPKAAPPPTQLQTTPAGSEGEVERSIRTMLTKAGSDLSRVNYRGLNADARTQYDTAKRFIQQAEEAVRAKNLVFAKNLAEKASTLAAQLAGK
jgi:outer membrane biosynthesis protein TonB